MAFILEKTQAVSFDCIEGMLSYVEHEKKHTARISVVSLLAEGATFHDDKFFGKGNYSLKFNQPALDDLCSLLGLYSPLLNKLDKAGLASDILNDRIHSEALKDSVKNALLFLMSLAKRYWALLAVLMSVTAIKTLLVIFAVVYQQASNSHLVNSSLKNRIPSTPICIFVC
jgi:hypothetical protein